MNLKVNNDQELREIAARAIRILQNIRYSTKQWKMHYGSVTRERMNHYEEMADLFLEKLGLTDQDRQNKLKIEIDDNS